MKRIRKAKGKDMKTYIFGVVVEPDEDRWHAYCPALEKYAATTWGYTEEEAFENIGEVVQMIIEELLEDGKPKILICGLGDLILATDEHGLTLKKSVFIRG